MDKDTAPARKGPPAYHTTPREFRTSGQLWWIVLHDTEGGTARTISRYFSEKSSGGSAHLVADDAETIRCLPDDVIPWAAPPANTNGLHIEMCGFAKWKAADWHHHEPMLARAAFQVAEWCKQYDIPATYVTAQGLRAGKHGITTHRDVSAAWHQSTHTNPGLGFPLSYFMGLVKGYITPPTAPKRFQVTWTKGDGSPGSRTPLSKSELDNFAGDVIAHHAEDPVPFVYQVTFFPDGAPQS